MITLEYLISVMNDDTEIVLQDFDGNQPVIFVGTVDAFKKSLYDTYKDSQVAYIEPNNFVLLIYIKV